MRKSGAGRPEQFPVKKVLGFDQAMIDAIDAWRRDQPTIPNQSQAIRSILSEHLRALGYLGEADDSGGA